VADHWIVSSKDKWSLRDAFAFDPADTASHDVDVAEVEALVKGEGVGEYSAER